MSSHIHHMSLIENNLEQQQESKRSSIDVIRETAQKQFSLGYQEPDPDQMTSSRDRLTTHERYNSQRQGQQFADHQQQQSPPKGAEEDEHIKITIELGEGLSEDIIVPAGMENCAPELAKQFCDKHGFEEAVVIALTDKIKENIEKIKTERRMKSVSKSKDTDNRKQQISTINNIPQEDTESIQELSPGKDLEAEVLYDNLYRQPPVETSINQNHRNQEIQYITRPESVDQLTEDFRLQMIQEEEIQRQMPYMDQQQMTNNTVDEAMVPHNMNIMQNSTSNRQKQLSRAEINNLQGLQFNPNNNEHYKPMTLGVPNDPHFQQQDSQYDMNQSKASNQHLDNQTQILPNDSATNFYKLNEHSTTSITDVEIQQNENTINNLILSSNLGLDSSIKQPQQNSQQISNLNMFSGYSKKNSNATQAHLNHTSIQEQVDSRLDSHYLIEAQNIGSTGNPMDPVPYGQQIPEVVHVLEQPEPNGNQTRNIQIKQSKSQLTRRHSKERSLQRDSRKGSQHKLDSRKGSTHKNFQNGEEGFSQQMKDQSVIGFESRMGSGGVYEELLAQSEYGYVAKNGRWKDSQTRKFDAEQIQKYTFNGGGRGSKSNDNNSGQRSRRGPNHSSADYRQSRKKYVPDLDLKFKPFVNQISQMLAKTSSKRAMGEIGEQGLRPRKSSVHDRLFQQPTKGKSLAKMQEQEEMRYQKRQGAKSSRNKGKKKLSKFLVSSRGDYQDQEQPGRHINQQSMNERQNFDQAFKNQSMRFDMHSNSLRPKTPKHKKSQTQIMQKDNYPVDNQGSNQNYRDHTTFNLQPVSIDLHTDMSGNLNFNQDDQQKFQTIQLPPVENPQKFQTIQLHPEDKEQIEYRTPAYRDNNHLSTTQGGKSEVIQLQVSGIDDKHQLRRDRSNNMHEDDIPTNNDQETNRNQMYSHQPHFGDEDTNPESENCSVIIEPNDDAQTMCMSQNYQQRSHNTIDMVGEYKNPRGNQTMDSQTGYSNVGERLYQKGLVRNQQRQNFINEMSRLKEAQELKGATFQPLTLQNMHNRYIKSQNEQSFAEFTSNTFQNNQHQIIREGQLVVDSSQKPKMDRHDAEHLGRRLMQYGQQLQLRKAAAKQYQDQMELDGLDFQPKICQKSVDMLNQRSMQRKIQQQSLQSQMSGQKFYGNSHLIRSDQHDSKSMINQKSTKQIEQNDSPLMNLNLQSQTNNQASGYFNQNEMYPIQESRQSQENILMNKEQKFFSPEMSQIQNEDEISKVKSPANYKSFNFQASPNSEQFLKSQSYNNMDQNDLIASELQYMSQKTFQNMSKHEALYNDAKHRSQRQREIYAKCIDKECTFKPEMITKKSNLSKKMIKEVQEEVTDRLNQRFQGNSTDFGIITTNSLLPSQQKAAQSSRQALKKYNEQMQYTQNDSILGAPIREIISYNETSMSNFHDYHEMYRQKSMDRNLKNIAGGSMTESGHQLAHHLSPQVSNSRIMYLNQTNPERKFKQPVFKRLSEQASVLQSFQKELKEKRQKSESSRDPVTGQRYFKPQIKRHQSQGRRNQPHQVGQALYTNYSLTQEKIKQKREEELNQLKEQRKVFARANSKSDRIIYNARKVKLGEIFDRIDHDSDGEISSNKIDISQLPENMVRIFKPLFNELQILSQPLDREEFVDAGMRLYDSLSQNEKNIILKFDKKAEAIDHEMQKCTFAPSINFSTVQHRINNKFQKPPGSFPQQQQQRSAIHSQRQTRAQRKLKKYLTKEPSGNHEAMVQNSMMVPTKPYQSIDQQELQNAMNQILKDAAMSGGLGHRYSRDGDNSYQQNDISKSSTPRRTLNQSISQMMSQRSSKKVEKTPSSLILNNQVTDQSLIKSVHQKFFEQQNNHSKSSQASIQQPLNSHLASVSESLHSNNQNPLIINQVMLTVPAEGPYDLPKPDSNLSIIDIGKKQLMSSKTLKQDNQSIKSQGSTQSVPKPFKVVPSMQVQPPAIIGNIQDSSQSHGKVHNQSRQSNQQFNGLSQSPFKINPQMIGSDNATSMSQISCNTQSQPKHQSSIGCDQISPVQEMADGINAIQLYPGKNQSVKNPYILHRTPIVQPESRQNAISNTLDKRQSSFQGSFQKGYSNNSNI